MGEEKARAEKQKESEKAEMRDRLMKLLADCQHEYDKECVDAISSKRPLKGEFAFYADHLLANGVIVPPCKVGDTVYQTDGARIYESCITHIEIYSFVTVFYTDGVAFDETAIGNSIYLTKEEAEKELAERSGE